MLRLARITTIDNTTIRVTFNSESSESKINYYRLNTYTPVLDDLVLVNEDLKIILGKVIK